MWHARRRECNSHSPYEMWNQLCDTLGRWVRREQPITAAAPPTAGRFQLVSNLAVSDSAPIPEAVSCLLQSEGNNECSEIIDSHCKRRPLKLLLASPLQQ